MLREAMAKQDPAKVKARKDRRKARAEEARAVSRRPHKAQSPQHFAASSVHEQVPQERLSQIQRPTADRDTSLEPLSLERQESDMAGFLRQNFLEFATQLRSQSDDCNNPSKQEETKKC